MAVNINKDKCVGCGRCTEVCPGSFKLGGDGKAEFLTNSDCVMKAADECPVEAIFVEE